MATAKVTAVLQRPWLVLSALLLLALLLAMLLPLLLLEPGQVGPGPWQPRAGHGNWAGILGGPGSLMHRLAASGLGLATSGLWAREPDLS